jgi:ribose transport system permease protein
MVKYLRGKEKWPAAGDAAPPAAAAATEGTVTAAAAVPARSRDGAAAIVSRYGLIAAMILTYVGFAVALPHSFFTLLTMKSILSNAAPLLIVAVGVTVVLVVNDFDLSVGGLAGLCSTLAVVGVSGVKLGLPVGVAVVLTIIAGGLFGLVNGIMIAYVGASSFIVTLAMGTLYNGLDTQILGSNTIYQKIPAGFGSIATGSFLGLSHQVYVGLVVALGVGGLLWQLEVGRYLYAIGGNREASRLSGVRVRALTAAAFAIAGACVAVAGILVSSQAVSASPNAGLGFLLPAYAAAFLGSSMWRPGTFTVFGTLLGALFLQIIGTGLTLFSLTGAIVSIIQGAILVVSVLLARVGAR